MRKYLFIILALLLTIGVANVYAAGIPVGVDPANSPEIWTMEVYNDSGSTLSSGAVVVWDYTDSDMYDLDLRKMYITTSATADDIATDGVIVTPSCVNGDICSMAIFGPVAVRLNSASGSLITAGDLVGIDAAGKAGDFAGGAADVATLGCTRSEERRV